ncbi:uncharacterized protein LOC105197161 isoform X1 [Solenopsis invicta]|uniref:uncharacterized protein LOC105197161 isoform X1 n=1 Tax=Solenopsis invicta TaxID=13686 RepID=UPI000E340025|nr:uncharacterized protein LOC105197161 isoform X1 [Solenopsis invicta]
MSRQLRGERDHVSRDYQEGYLSDFRDLRDLRDFRDFHRDTSLDERDGQGLREGPTTGRTYRDDYPEEYDHRPTAASTSANLERTNNPAIRGSLHLYPPFKRIKRTSRTPAVLLLLLFQRHVALHVD